MTEPITVDPRLFPFMPHLAPGVIGFAQREGDELVVSFVAAESQGSGDVGRYLDGLRGTVVVPNVLSHRLAGMLARRGFVEEPLEPPITKWVRRD